MKENHENNGVSRPTVCVIGCGPGGMFFLHALATRRHRLQEEGDTEGLASLPDATCYERCSMPGGVWRSSRGRRGGNKSDGTPIDNLQGDGGAKGEKLKKEAIDSTPCEEDKKEDEDDFAPGLASLSDECSEESVSLTNMYESLWTNGHKEPMEFFDYTFDEHFGRPMPVYMCRQHMLNYMLCRVTSKEDIFKKYVRFNATVTSVSYDSSISKFLVSTVIEDERDRSRVIETKLFNKVIWAGGLNGLPNIPQNTINALQKGGFNGEMLHSTEVHDLDIAACGKRLVFIGGNYSAEDLALQSIKLGAERIFISSRGEETLVTETSAWPGNRVEILKGSVPTGVTADGNGIVFHPCEWNYTTKTYEANLEGEPTIVEDVSTVIFCTGYKANMDYIDPELRACMDFNKLSQITYRMPGGWKSKHNSLTEDLGHIQPSEEIGTGSCECVFLGSGIYRHLLMKNPNMMYLSEYTDFPILYIDVNAWVCLGYICGDVEIPPIHEMERRMMQQLVDEMSIPELRKGRDDNFYKVLDALPADHWYKKEDPSDDRYLQFWRENITYMVKVLARDMLIGGYPVDFGTYEELNNRGESLVTMGLIDEMSKCLLKKDGPDSAWRTFRDSDPKPFRSLHTGTTAAPLEGHWMDLDDDGHVLAHHDDTE